jgi:large subunit ribosomal protein L25
MEIDLKVEARSGRGKGPARRARAAGQVPAVLYGSSVEGSVPLLVGVKEIKQALHTEAGANVLVNLLIDKQKHLTMFREIQRDPVRGDFVHVDFVAVDRDQTVHADIPIHIVGESHGVKEGGVVEHHLWDLKIEAFPTDVPPSIEADITALGIGENLHVSDLLLPKGVTVLSAPEEIVVSVVEPQVIQLPEEAAAEEAAAAAEAAEGEAPTAEGAPETGESAE